MAIVGSLIIGAVLTTASRSSRQDADINAGPGEVVLYAFDDSRSSFSFSLGEYGCVERDGVIYNRLSQILLSTQPHDQFAVGCSGGEIASVLDLGDPRDTNTQTSLFASIVRTPEGWITLRRNEYSVRNGWDAIKPIQPVDGMAQAPIRVNTSTSWPSAT